MKRFVVLFGPTAVGKTALTEELFNFGMEVVNADSVQIYKYLDIGSAKPDLALRAKIPHHLLDIRNPWESYSSGEFVHDAENAVDEILNRAKVPLLTGGTGYYFRQFLYGESKAPKADAAVREMVNKMICEKGLRWAHDELKRVDPVSAGRIHPNDKYRISRALEVFYCSGRPLSSFPVSNVLRKDFSPLVIGLFREKTELEERIKKRIDIMFSSGFMEEIGHLKEMGADLTWPSMDAIGYREAFSEYSSIDDLKEKIFISTRKYAKRQMTFFRSFPETKWFSADENEAVTEEVKRYLSI